MAIKMRDEQGFTYRAVLDGVLSEAEKKQADRLYREAEKKLSAITGAKKGLEQWYRRGYVANSLLEAYSLSPDETKYFWRMLFSCAGTSTPERAKKDGILRNDFWIAAFLESKYQFEAISGIDPSWSTWQEIFGSRPVKNDIRVSEWLIAYLRQEGISSRDNIRPILKKIGTRLKSLNTSILTDSELSQKLDEMKI